MGLFSLEKKYISRKLMGIIEKICYKHIDRDPVGLLSIAQTVGGEACQKTAE